MGIFDRLLDGIKINDEDDDYLDDILDEDEEDYDDEDEFLDDEIEKKPRTSFFSGLRSNKSSKKSKASNDDDYDDDFEDLDDLMDEEEEKAPIKPRTVIKAKPEPKPVKKPIQAEKIEKPQKQSKITPMRSSNSGSTIRRASIPANIEVCVIRPTSMENTREIADTLLDNATVILNLEGIDVELAQRIIDFASGVCYAIQGTLNKVTSYIFILGPESVEISGDLQDLLVSTSVESVRNRYI